MRRAIVLLALAVGCAEESAKPTESAAPAPGDSIDKETSDGPVKAKVSLAPAKPKLGDPIVLTLTVEAEAGVEVEMPPFGEALGRFSVRDFTPRQGERAGGGTVQTHVYRLDPPMSGRQRIPPLRIEFVDKRPGQNGDEAHELFTDEIPVVIESVVPEGELASQLRPARAALPLGPLSSWWARMWPVFAVGGALICAGAAFVLWRRGAVKKKKVSAYKVALERLRALEARGYPSAAAADAWYVELSAIVRRYLEDRYGLRAPELTTEEFLREARRSADLSPAHRELLTSFLEGCDRVKFAAYHPQETESQEALGVSRRFIEETRTVEEEAAA